MSCLSRGGFSFRIFLDNHFSLCRSRSHEHFLSVRSFPLSSFLVSSFPRFLVSSFPRFLVSSFLLFIIPFSASALLMRDDGPEPVIVQIKESLRTSDDLDSRLAEFALLRQQSRVDAIKWWAGRKLLVMLSFPTNFTEQQALAVIARLKQSPAVEKVVAQSAFNLEFKSGDFSRDYEASAAIPDAARRGFDVAAFLVRQSITAQPLSFLFTLRID